MWYVFVILVWTTTPPNIFGNYESRPLPVSYKTFEECRSGIDWLKANAPSLVPPIADAKQVFACVQI